MSFMQSLSKWQKSTPDAETQSTLNAMPGQEAPKFGTETTPQMNQLPMYHSGGDVPSDQVAKLKGGERVLNPVETHAYKSAAIGNAPDTPLGRIGERFHELWDKYTKYPTKDTANEEVNAIRAKQEQIDALKRQGEVSGQGAEDTNSQLHPYAPSVPSPADFVHPGAAYGMRPGEKRLDTQGNVIDPTTPAGLGAIGPKPPVPTALGKPLPSYGDGGTVPEDQVAQVHEDEHVLDPEKAAVYRQAEAEESAKQFPEPQSGPVEVKADTDNPPAPKDSIMNTSNAPAETPMQLASAKAPLGTASTQKPTAMRTLPYQAVEGRPGALQVVPEAPKPKEETAPDPMAIIQQDKLEAAQKGHAGLADLGLAMIHENAFSKPAYTGTKGDMQAENQRKGKELHDKTVADLTKTMLHGATPQIRHQAEADLADYKLHTPLGGDESARPGKLGKIEHVLGRIGQAALMPTAPYLLPAIPGTQASLENEKARGEEGVELAQKGDLTAAQTAKAKEITPQQTIMSATEELRNAKTSEEQSAAQSKIDAATAAIDAGKPSAEKALTSRDLFNKEQEIAKEADPTKKAALQEELAGMQQAMSATQKPTAEEDNRAFDAVTKKIQLSGLKVDPINPAKSIDAALAAGSITQEEAATAKGWLLRHAPAQTKIDVHGAEGEQTAEQKSKGKTYAYKDANGDVKWATGDKVPQGVEAIEIPHPEAELKEAQTANIIQESLNKLHEDIDKDGAVLFDNLAARSIITEATTDTHMQQLQGLVAGTGGSIALPGAISKLVDQWLQNTDFSQLSPKDRDAVKHYIADYVSMKDKAMAMQMQIQGGKLGRGAGPIIQSIFDQLPGGTTPDSKVARQKLGNVQDTINTANEMRPKSYATYKRAEPHKYSDEKNTEKGAGSPPPGATDEVLDGKGKVIGHVVVENGKKKFVKNQ